MKKMMKRSLAIAISLMMVLAMTACGSEKKDDEFRTPKLFDSITKKTGLHMDFELEDEDTKMDFYTKKDNVYMDYDIDGEKAIIIVDDEYVTVLDPANKTGDRIEMTDDVEEQIDKLSVSVDKIYDMADVDKGWKKGTVKQDGMEYESEEVGDDKKTTKFLYNDDDELVYVIAEEGDDKTVIKINAFDDKVPKDIFEVPDGYTINGSGDSNPEPKTDDNKKTGSSGMPSPSGKYATYTISSGYQFDYDTAYTVDENEADKITRVYTYEKGGVPFFYLSLIQNRSGQSAQELLSGVGNQKVKDLGDKLVKGPITNTVQAGDRKIDGLEWIYKSDDGSKEYVGVQYTEVIGTFFFNWCAVYETGDTETPKALEHAMSTFKMLAT